jgi:TolB-like protein
MRHEAPGRFSGSPVSVCNNRAVRPTNEDIIGALERVLASPSFASASRLSRFLRFVVERELAGDADRLKEYAIGIEVFDRDEKYDPRIDSIVRVEAGRLRTKLEEYYRGAGSSDPVEIRIHRGRYVPEFDVRTHSGAALTPTARPATPVRSTATEDRPADRGPPAPADSGTVAAPADAHLQGDVARALSSGRRLRATLAATVVLAAALLTAAYWRYVDRAQSTAPVIAVLPFQPYSDEEVDRMLATRLTEGISAELVRLDRFGVVPSSSAREFANPSGSLRDVARALEADFLLEARVLSDGEAVRVEARLVDGAGNRKIWVDTIAGDAADLDDLIRRVAAAAAAAPLNRTR